MSDTKVARNPKWFAGDLVNTFGAAAEKELLVFGEGHDRSCGLNSTYSEITRTLPFDTETRGKQNLFTNIEGVCRLMQSRSQHQKQSRLRSG